MIVITKEGHSEPMKILKNLKELVIVAIFNFKYIEAVLITPVTVIVLVQSKLAMQHICCIGVI